MPNSYVNASEVQNAYTLPLNGVLGAFNYADQVSLHRQQQEKADRKEKDAEDFRKAQLLEQAFQGTDIGTGTPYDEIGNKLVGDAKSKLKQYMAEQPGASYTDLYYKADEAARPLLAGITEAKKVQSLIDHEVTRANKEYPHIDSSVLNAYYQNKAFRDKDNNILPRPNYNFYGNELATSADRARFLNPLATAQGVQKELAEGFKPEEYAITDPSAPGAILRGKTRRYLSPTGQVLQEPVSWQVPTPMQGTVSPDALYKPWAAPASPGQLPQTLDTRTMAGVPDSLLGALKAKPVFADALELEKSRLRAEHGDYLKGAPDDSIERIAAHNLVTNYGSRDGVEQPKPDYKIADHAAKEQHQALQESIAAKNLQLHARSVELAGINTGIRLSKEQKKKASDLETVPNQLFLSRMSPDALKPEERTPAMLSSIKHAQMLEANNREFMRVQGIDRPVPITNLSKWAGRQLYEPGTKNPVVLKLANMGGKTGEVLYQIPVKHNKHTQRWEEDMQNAKVYGSAIGENGTNSFRKSVADILQQYDPQWKKSGIKDDDENNLESALPEYTPAAPSDTNNEEE